MKYAKVKARLRVNLGGKVANASGPANLRRNESPDSKETLDDLFPKILSFLNKHQTLIMGNPKCHVLWPAAHR